MNNIFTRVRMRHIFLTLALSCLSFFSIGQSYNYVNGTLDITIDAYNPCGVNNGFLDITVNNAEGGQAILVFLDGPGGNDTFGVPIDQGSTFSFNPGKTLPIGTYEIIIRDILNNFTINTFVDPSYPPIVLSSIAPVTLSEDIRIDNGSCAFPTTGQIQASISGGSQVLAGGGSYDFRWTADNGFIVPDFTGTTDGTTPLNLATLLGVPGLPGGTYDLFVTDNFSGCGVVQRTFVLTDPSPAVYNITTISPQVICAGDNITIALDNSDGATVTYEVYRNGAGTGITFPGAGGGPFPMTFPSTVFSNGDIITIRATDGFCSPAPQNGAVGLTINPIPTITGVSVTDVCQGIPSTNILYTGTTGSPNQYSIDFNASAEAQGFTDIVNAVLPASPFALTVPGAAAPGTYNGNLTVRNTTTGCVSLVVPISITVNPLPTAVASGGGSVCTGDVLPDVTFTFTGTAPFDFTYTDGVNPPVNVVGHAATTFTIPNAPAGSYIVTALTDANVCSGTDFGTAVVVTMNPLPTATTSGGGTVCSGDVLPDVTFTFTGTAPFDFTYTDGVAPVNVVGHATTTFTIPNAPAGSYIVTALTDANTCSAVDFGTAADVVVNPLPTAVASGGGSVCTGDVLPDVTFTFTGTAPFDFTYTDGVNPPVNVVGHATPTFTIPNAPAGNYIVTALTDANACSGTDFGTAVVVTMNPLPTATTSGGGTVCSGDVLPDVTFTFTGTAPFDFTYTDGVAPVNVVGHATTTFTIPNAPAGSYIVTALTDANTCAAVDFGTAADVVVNPLPTAVASGGGSVCTGDVLPDVTFTFTGTAPFDFTYTDGVNPPVNVVGHATTTFTIPNAPAGNYIVTALTDANVCAGTDFGTAVAVTVNPLPTASTSGGGTVCSGDVLPDVTFTFTGTAPFDFTYTDGATPVNIVGHATNTFTIANAPAGSYIVTALTDANTCAAVDFGTAADVVVNPLPTAVASGGGSVCTGDVLPDVTFTFTGTAPFDFTYTDGTTPVNVVGHAATTFTIPNAPAGNYIVTALTDANACSGTDFGTAVAVTMNPLPTATTSGGGTVCSGDVLPDVTFTFTGTAPFDFTYTDGVATVNVVGHATNTFTIANAPAGSYIVTALTDANTCAAVDFGTATDVVVNPLPTAVASGGGSVCTGDVLPDVTFTFTGTAPFDFTYTDGTTPVNVVGHAATTFTIPNAPAGSYIVTALTDANACSGTDFGTAVAVTMNPLPTATTSGGGTVCSGDVLPDVTFTFTGTAPFDFTYTDGITPVNVVGHATTTFTIANAPAGSYIVTALTDANTCAAVDFGTAADVVVNPSPTIALDPIPAICPGTTTVDLSYSATTDSPDTYSIDFDAVAEAQGFVDIVDAPLPASPIVIAVPGAAIPGTYNATLTVTSSGTTCSSAPTNITITITPLIAAPSVVSPVSLCVGSPAPVLTASSAGATDYNWYTDAGLTNLIFTGANYTPAGTELDVNVVGSTSFFVTAFDACGEGSASTVVVDVLDDATINIPTNPVTVCEGVGNVDLTTLVSATPLGGTFVFAGTNVTGDFFDPTGLAGTAVAITVDYTTGSCVAASVILNIDVTDVATLTLPIADVPVCESGGTIDLLTLVSAVPAGGTFSFSGTGVTGTTFDPSGLNGIQAITVSYDASGCVGNGVFNIDVVPDVTVSVTDSDVCETGGVVSLLGFVSGVPAGGTFTFAGAGVTGTDFDPLGLSGPQNITVDYAIGGCADNATLVLNVINTTPPVVVSPVTLCVNSATPTLTASNGDPGVVDFNWYTDAGLTNLIFTGANYTPAASELDMTVVASTSFFVTTVYGCGESTPATVIVDVLNGATITIPTNPVDVCESGGLVDLTTLVSGLPAAGTFTFTGTNVTGSNFDPTGLTGVMVSILVDYTSGGCIAPTATLDINVIDLASINFPVTTPQVCETGGVIDLTTFVSGNPAGGTFAFSGTNVTGSDFDPTGLSGLQTITVNYDAGGCLANGIFDIDVVTIAALTLNNGFTCENGSSIDLLTRVSGNPAGGTFTFAGTGVTGNTFNPFGLSGAINIAVTYDAGGCLANGTLVMTVLDAADPLCAGGGINCNVFTVTVSDSRPSCADQDDGTITFTVAGGTPNYIVTLTNALGFAQALPGSGPNFTFNNLSPADYSYTIQDAIGNTCTLPYSLPIQTTVLASADPASFVDALCFGTPTGSAIINASGSQTGQYFYSIDGVSWTLFTPGNPINDLPPNGTYNILVGESIGDACRASVPVTINSQNPDMVVTYSVTNATCDNDDGSITVNPPSGGGGGPYEFSISNGMVTVPFQTSPTFTNLAGGIYSLLVRDGIGCIKTIAPVNVTFPGFVNFTTIVNNADCTNNGNSGSIVVTVTDIGSTYRVALSQDQFNEPSDADYQNYVSPSVMFSGLPRGVYYLYVKSATAACPTRSAPIIIQGSYAMTFDIVPICADNEVSLSLTNITGEPNIPFEIRVFRKFTNIIEETIPVPEILPTGSFLIRYNDPDAIINQSRVWLRTPGEYQIQIVQVQSTFCLLESPLIDYRVRPTLSATVLRTTESYPDIATGSMTIGDILGGSIDYEIRIELDSAAVTGQFFQTNWEVVGQNSNLEYEKVYNKIPAGRYKIEVMDANGCVFELIGRVPLDTDLYVPNVFTPNGDGINDTFFIRNLPVTGGAQMVVSNRWGKEVFSTKDYKNNWDGGDIADGVYYYRLSIPGGTTLNGWVEIMRGKKP